MKYVLPSLGAVAATALFAFSTFNHSAFAVERPANEQTFEQLGIFATVLAKVRKDYVVEVDDSTLIDEALDGMLHSLDPHSSYLSPDDFRDMESSSRGEYGGLGMEVTTEDGVVKVVTPMDDTPAKRAGIESGDAIIQINGESIIGLSLSEAVDQMRGEPGEPISITVLREGEDEPLEFDLVREIIKRESVRHEVMDGVGYIRISAFNETTGVGIENAVKELKKEMGGKLPGVVIDLRSNPGGLLDQSIRVSSVFLDGGEVVSVRSRDPKDTARYNARRGDMLKDVPVVVLINEASASAAEIVAGALQDRDRAVIVGMTSFGKGSVQSIIPLNGGRDGALRLTTARYYTPSGRSIQALGVEPDIAISYVKNDGKKRLSFKESDLQNSLLNDNEEVAEDSAEVEVVIDYPPEEFEVSDDYQLKRAIEIVKQPDFASLLD